MDVYILELCGDHEGAVNYGVYHSEEAAIREAQKLADTPYTFQWWEVKKFAIGQPPEPQPSVWDSMKENK